MNFYVSAHIYQLPHPHIFCGTLASHQNRTGEQGPLMPTTKMIEFILILFLFLII